MELLSTVELVEAAEELLPSVLLQAAMLRAIVAAIARASIPVSIFFMLVFSFACKLRGWAECPVPFGNA